MKKYHVATGDGKSYYGIGYESYRQAESLLKISQEHDPEAHIVEEDYPFTNADRIRAMSDEELAWELMTWRLETEAKHQGIESNYPNTQKSILEWLKQPAEDANPFHYEKGCQPHGAEQFAKACAVCVNSGSDLCRDCKAEKKSGFEPPF